MYIRQTTQKNKRNGESYATHRLVESYRNPEGKVRQMTLLNLGSTFNFTQDKWKLIADRVEAIRKGQQDFFPADAEIEKEAQRIAKLIIKKFSETPMIVNKKSDEKKQLDIFSEILQDDLKNDYQTVDINSLKHSDIRKIGAEHVGLHAAKQLNLDKILLDIGCSKKQMHLALGNIIGRLVHPGSERNTHRYLSEQSALDELLETNFSNLSLNNFYQIADILFKNKTKIETALYSREKDLFNLEETITLYDLTNTYFEGRATSNPKALRGRSKEKRGDCPLIALGMLLDGSGFPKKSELFPGNVGEPKTLEKMLELLGDNKKATIVMDAGIASEENLAWLKLNNRTYIVVSRKRKLVMPDDKDTVIVKENKNNLVTVSLVENKETDEFELYCHSQAKEEKTKQMQSKFTTHFEMELRKIKDGLTKKQSVKKYSKVTERIGRLKEKYRKVGKLYSIVVTPDEENKNAIDIMWDKIDEESNKNKLGVYVLRTNQKNLDEKTFWNTYTMLTELEAAFRSLKSELGLRPIYHQKENRVDAHIFISIIAYHLLHTIRYQLKEKNINSSWQTLREVLDTQCRITSTLQLSDGKTVQVRKSSSPDVNQSEIYRALHIETHPGKTEKTYI